MNMPFPPPFSLASKALFEWVVLHLGFSSLPAAGVLWELHQQCSPVLTEETASGGAKGS